MAAMLVALEPRAFTTVALRAGADTDLVDLVGLGAGRDEPTTAALVASEDLVAVKLEEPKAPKNVAWGVFVVRWVLYPCLDQGPSLLGRGLGGSLPASPGPFYVPHSMFPRLMEEAAHKGNARAPSGGKFCEANPEGARQGKFPERPLRVRLGGLRCRAERCGPIDSGGMTLLGEVTSFCRPRTGELAGANNLVRNRCWAGRIYIRPVFAGGRPGLVGAVSRPELPEGR